MQDCFRQTISLFGEGIGRLIGALDLVTISWWKSGNFQRKAFWGVLGGKAHFWPTFWRSAFGALWEKGVESVGKLSEEIWRLLKAWLHEKGW